MVTFRQKEFRKKISQVTVVQVSRREEKIQLCGKNLHFQFFFVVNKRVNYLMKQPLAERPNGLKQPDELRGWS